MLRSQIGGYNVAGTVDLTAVLQARDRRSAKRKKLLAEKGRCLLSVTLLMPGTVKTTKLSRAFLREYCSYLRKQLQGQNICISGEEALADPAGDSYFFVFSAETNPVALKKTAMLLETEFAWSRALDLDLYLSDGRQLSRSDLDLPERSCLICSEQAHVCSRSRRHSIIELQNKIQQFQADGLRQLLPERMQSSALAAAFSELLVAPKPGLVTGTDAGSHADMDRFTYADSTAALAGYFGSAAGCGLAEALRRKSAAETAAAKDEAADFVEIVSKLHFEGMRAERLMFAASHGVNTQKGFIYLAGIVLAAAASLALEPQVFAFRFKKESEHSVTELWQKEISRWTAALHKIQAALPAGQETAGKRIQRLYGISGVRGEAASGLATVFQLSLPFYRGLRRRKLAKNEAAATTLLLLLAATDDTNLINRAGLNRTRLIQKELVEFFEKLSQSEGYFPEQLQINSSSGDQVTGKPKLMAADVLTADCLDNVAARESSVISYIEQWDDYFKENGYSPGGAADLLAVCFLVLELLSDI